MSDPMDDELRSLIALEKDAWSEPGDARTRLESKLGPIFAAHAAVAVGAAVGAAAGAGGTGTGVDGAGAVGNAVSVADGAGATGDAASGIDTAIAGATQGGHAAVGTAARVVGMAGRAFRWPALAVAVSGGAALGSATTAAVLRATADPPPARIEVRYVDRVVEVEKGRDAGASVDVSDLPLAPVPSPAPSPAPATASTSATESGMSDQDLVRERRLIDTARSALARRDATSALAALDEHARAFPRGQLVEMREALAVQALVQAGKSDEARARATRFHRRYRGSIYESVVDGALSSIP